MKTYVDKNALQEYTTKLAAKLNIQSYYVTPEMFGYEGGDATSYVNQCVQAIQLNIYTKAIRFRKGTYELKDVDLLDGEYDVIIDKGATITPTVDATYIFNIGTTGSAKIYGGGKIDVNYLSNRAIIAYIHNDQYLYIDNIEFARIKSNGIYVNEFGGNLTIQNCYVHDMQYQTATKNSADFLHIISGQEGYRGNFIFTGNRLIEDSYKESDYVHGAGGIFIADVVDATNQKWGNKSNAIITNNIFDGLGSARQPIYSVHVYYEWDGVIIDSNVFKNYYECAIGVKDSNNVVISNNVFEDGQIGITEGRSNYAGAINWQPSDHTPGTEHFGLNINNNVFKNAPRSTETIYTSFITLWGRIQNNVVQEYGNDVIITGNKFDTGRRSVYASGINNITFSDNICRTSNVITMTYCKGNVIFSGNDIISKNASILVINDGNCGEVKLNVFGNNCIDTSDDSGTHRLFFIRSVYSCNFANNYIYSNYANSIPAEFGRYDSSSTNINRLNIVGNILDGSNKQYTFSWAYIDAVEGDVFASGSPVNTVNSVGAGRCKYYDTTAGKYYVSISTSAWKEISLTTPA